MRIVVVGDVVVDHHVYEGERTSPSATQSRGVQVRRETGGAHSLTRLIAAMSSAYKDHRMTLQRLADAEHEREVKDYDEKRTDRTPRREVVSIDPNEKVEAVFGLTLPELNSHPCGHHALAIFKQFPKYAYHLDPVEAGKKVWRGDLLLGYGHDAPEAIEATTPASSCETFQPKPTTEDAGDVLVLDDAGFTFRNAESCWLLPKEIESGPRWIVLKMSRPICRGPLWQALQPFRDRLIVIVSASELRHESASISTGLSWERTVEDLVVAIDSDPVLTQLKCCRHLIVSFSADGALWVNHGAKTSGDKLPTTSAELVYDAGSIEGQWAEQSQGEVFGFLSCLVAATTAALVRQLDDSMDRGTDTSTGSSPAITPDLASAMGVGLATMRDLRLRGHGEVHAGMPTGYPIARLAEVLVAPVRGFSRCSVPWDYLVSQTAEFKQPWSIAVQSQVVPTGSMVAVPMRGLAHQVVQRGRRMLTHLPHARFGNLFTIDRGEIETLRTLRHLMQQYKKTCRMGSAAGKPLSVGVFGPPGAGKSFGVKQIANEIFGKPAWLEFNLSQFGDKDLIGALHQVRDKVLEVGIPVVFWDEFDARRYHWLQYLLAPMQDGRFQEGQLSHPIGHCVFIFAGATSHTFQEFGPARPAPDSTIEVKEAWNSYVLSKGPDFLSRLDGYYNVLGPNARKVTGTDGEQRDDPNDLSSPIRRALLLRQFLCGDRNHRLGIELGLLRALLEVPAYRNGARSLEKLSLSLRPADATMAVRRSSLGSPEQLAMFVDFPSSSDPLIADAASPAPLTPVEIHRRFTELCTANEQFQQADIVEGLAAAVHGFYRQLASQPGMTIQEMNDREYAGLEEDTKASNRAAARRISDVLAVAGLQLRSQGNIPALLPNHDQTIAAHIEQHLENMAELEHDLWCEERQSQGWRYGSPRHDRRRLHPLLIPYVDLPEKEKEKDRNQIRSYRSIVASAGLQMTFAE